MKLDNAQMDKLAELAVLEAQTSRSVNVSKEVTEKELVDFEGIFGHIKVPDGVSDEVLRVFGFVPAEKPNFTPRLEVVVQPLHAHITLMPVFEWTGSKLNEEK